MANSTVCHWLDKQIATPQTQLLCQAGRDAQTDRAMFLNNHRVSVNTFQGNQLTKVSLILHI